MTPLAAPADRPARTAADLPATLKTAVILWVACALLGLLNAGLGFVLAGLGVPVNAGQRDAFGVAIGLVFALLILALALQTGTGRSAGTRGAGNASLLLGLLYAGFAGLSSLITIAGQGWGGAEAGLYAAAGLLAVQAVLLIAAGVLARHGRDDYATWRASRPAATG
jgi:hypothetical protein